MTGEVRDPGVEPRTHSVSFTYQIDQFMGDGDGLIVWRDGLVVGHGNGDLLTSPYELRPDGIAYRRGEIVSEMRIAAGKLVARADAVGDQTERFDLIWDGTRLIRINKIRSPGVTIELELGYDCRAGRDAG
jgi:hypothetical protein